MSCFCLLTSTGNPSVCWAQCGVSAVTKGRSYCLQALLCTLSAPWSHPGGHSFAGSCQSIPLKRPVNMTWSLFLCTGTFSLILLLRRRPNRRDLFSQDCQICYMQMENPHWHKDASERDFCCSGIRHSKEWRVSLTHNADVVGKIKTPPPSQHFGNNQVLNKQLVMSRIYTKHCTALI